MYLVLIKFVEVFTRAVFVVGTTYSLQLSGAGQFGIIATLVGLFAFAFNWERHIDIQRRHVGQPAGEFDRAVIAALPFWGFNQLLMLPLFLIAAALMAHLTAWQLMLAAVIVTCEHVANQTYQMALISRRYWHFLNIVAAKNIVVLGAILPFIVFAPSLLTLDYVLIVWATGQAVCAATVFIVLGRVKQNLPHESPFSFREHIFRQHRSSLTHFLLGTLAILMLQIDRLIVGSLLPLEEVGTYFRHLLVVSFVYQFFNVASLNRVSPTIFAMAKQGATFAAIMPKLRREYLFVVTSALVAFGFAIGVDASVNGTISAKYHLSITLATIMLAGALIRIVADFAGLICNAWHCEVKMLRIQLMTFLFSSVLLVILTWYFRVFGAAIASAAGSTLYLILMARTVRALQPRATI